MGKYKPNTWYAQRIGAVFAVSCLIMPVLHGSLDSESYYLCTIVIGTLWQKHRKCMESGKIDKISAKRICIYPKDLQVLTGKSERYARKVVAKIRRHYEKDKYQLLTIKEFCDYMGLEEEEVKEAII